MPVIPCPVCHGAPGGCQGCNYTSKVLDIAGEGPAASSARPLRRRRPVALGRDSAGELVVLANDGTLWRLVDGLTPWDRLPDLPQSHTETT